MIDKLILQCMDDAVQASVSGNISLDAQVRAYDLLDLILSGYVDRSAMSACEKTLAENLEAIEESYDADRLMAELTERLSPLKEAHAMAEKKAEEAEALHNMAAQTFSVWSAGGFFAKWKALRSLRRMAGFRLERHRIGNYVAKTYDLMEAARRDVQKARRELLSADVSYKVQEGIPRRILQELSGKE